MRFPGTMATVYRIRVAVALLHHRQVRLASAPASAVIGKPALVLVPKLVRVECQWAVRAHRIEKFQS